MENQLLEYYSRALRKSLAVYGGMNLNQIASVVSKFETTAKQSGSIGKAYAQAVDAYSDESGAESLKTVESQLLALLRNQTLEVLSPLEKMTRHTDAHNAKVSCMSIEILGVDENKLSNWQKEALREARQARADYKREVPQQLEFKDGHLVKPRFFEARGSFKGKKYKLELEVSSI